jgi:hypothetical protein
VFGRDVRGVARLVAGRLREVDVAEAFLPRELLLLGADGFGVVVGTSLFVPDGPKDGADGEKTGDNVSENVHERTSFYRFRRAAKA